MSRIRDALDRLQSSQPESGRRKPAEARRVPVIASVSGNANPAAGRAVELDFLGRLLTIDNDALVEAGFLASGAGQFRLADEFRLIKRPIIANARHAAQTHLERANLIAVTSAVSGEGKTFTCINLALSIAREKELSVILVDADCARQHVSTLFSANDEPGLLDVLRDDSIDPRSVIMPTTIESLAVMPAGTRDEYSAELLASERMAQVAELLSRDPKRIIIFDTSPLLMTTESSVLSSQVGQVILVVRAASTPRGDVISAAEKLDQSKAINLVLNQVDFGRSGPLSGYYGHYGADNPGLPEDR